ncbi:hypothetical protein GCM10023238_24930 [Streptomyces heliomycini]
MIETRAEPTGVEVVVADLSEGIPAEVAEREINGVLIQYRAPPVPYVTSSR